MTSINNNNEMFLFSHSKVQPHGLYVLWRAIIQDSLKLRTKKSKIVDYKVNPTKHQPAVLRVVNWYCHTLHSLVFIYRTKQIYQIICWTLSLGATLNYILKPVQLTSRSKFSVFHRSQSEKGYTSTGKTGKLYNGIIYRYLLNLF